MVQIFVTCHGPWPDLMWLGQYENTPMQYKVIASAVKKLSVKNNLTFFGFYAQDIDSGEERPF